MDGITGSVMGYYRNMDKTDMTIDFVLPNELPEYLQNDIDKNKTRIFVLPMKLRKLNPISYVSKLKKIIEKGKYDIVHAHGSSAILFLEMYAAKLGGCKIRIAHSRNTKTNHPIMDKILRPFFYSTYTQAFACGKEAGEWLFGKKTDVKIIPNGSDCNKFKYNQEIREEYRKNYNLENKIVVGHVGNFNYQKNHEFLIEIFEELARINDNYYLVLIGSNREKKNHKEDIQKLVKSKGLEKKVLFVGKTKEVDKWLQAMDIMVFPSRFEGFPNVLIEWQIAGLPCIISDKITKDVKITDLVQFESIDKTPKEWAEKINYIEKNNRSNQRYIQQIKDAGYDIKENAVQLKEIYKKLIEKEKL